MPTFEITSPDGRKFRVTAPEGATQDEVMAYAQQNMPAPEKTPEPPKRSMGDELKRQAGLTLRYGAQGLASLPGVVLDPFQNLAGGRKFTDAVGSTLDRFGVPRPESGAEKIAGAVSEAVAGGSPLVKAMKAAPGFSAGLDAMQAGTGAAAAEGVRQQGGPEWAALLAGAVAPVGVSAAKSGVTGAARAVNEVRRPLTKAGQEQVAADVLGRMVQGKDPALMQLAKHNAIRQMEEQTGKPIMGVPGSKPTSGAVSADYGLIGGQQLLERGEAGPLFAQQRAGNNAARLDELAKLRATESQLAGYVARRDQITAPMRDAVFSKATKPVDVDSVLDEVFRTFRSEKAQGEDAKRALNYIYGRLEQSKAEGATSAADLYNGLHKDLNQMVRKGIDSENGRIRLSAGVATGIKNKLADAIEESAPGFRRYLNTYSRLSRPIERLEYITERLGGENLSRVSTSMPQVGPDGPQFTLSQAAMRREVGKLESESPVPLAPYQRDVLGRVMGDLNSAELAARGGKPPGSDTYQNIAGANFVSRLLGQGLAESGIGKTAQRPLNFAYRPFESNINDLIVEAFQDPKKMEELLRKARTTRQSPKLTGLLDAGAFKGSEGLLGAILGQ